MREKAGKRGSKKREKSELRELEREVVGVDLTHLESRDA